MNQAQQAAAMAMIRVSSLAPVLRELDKRTAEGRAADAGDRLLARHLLNRQTIADPYAEIPLPRYLAFLEDAALMAGDPLLCARVGTGFRPADLGPVGLIFAASGTLRRGLQRLVHGLAAWQDDTALRIEVADDALVWTYRITTPDIGAHRQDSEYTLAATLALARDVFGAAGRPREIHVEHDAPPDPAGLARVLGLRPSFGQSANRLIFDRAAAERIQRPEDEGLIAILSRHVDDLHRPAVAGDLVSRVRGLIALHLGQRPVTLALIAAELNLSTRSLQRKLAEAGTALRPLVLQARLDMAQDQLREGRVSNAEIARRLGYADGTGLWRAFKTATGQPPKARRGRPG